jgi:prepilin-type N-terminal cleavage/methylation domain-containing protein
VKVNKFRPAQPASVQGFTIIEVLVATLLLGVLVMSVMAPLSSLFGLTRTSGNQLASTTLAQNVMEQAKGLWRDQAFYDRNCLAGVTLTGTTLTFSNLNTVGVVTPAGNSSTPVTTANCNTTALATPFTPVSMKRLTVVAGTGTSATTLQLDISRPQ